MVQSDARFSNGLFKKTKMCKFFQLNMCKRGEACTFAHNHHELQQLPDLQKTKMCSKVTKNRQCTDPDCGYAHSRSELRTVAADRNNSVSEIDHVANNDAKMGFWPVDRYSPCPEYSNSPANHIIEQGNFVMLMLPMEAIATKTEFSRHTTPSTQCQSPRTSTSGELSFDDSQFDDDSSDRSDCELTSAAPGCKWIIKNTLLELAPNDESLDCESGVKRLSHCNSSPALFHSFTGL